MSWSALAGRPRSRREVCAWSCDCGGGQGWRLVGELAHLEEPVKVIIERAESAASLLAAVGTPTLIRESGPRVRTPARGRDQPGIQHPGRAAFRYALRAA